MRTFYAGGSYADAHPSGAFAVLMPNGVQTHVGLIPYEAGTRPLYVRLYPAPFKFAGQASNRFGTMVWDGAWHHDPRIPNGTSGCIFDRDGVLRIIEAGPDQPSQGYRYVAFDGTLVTGDETYGPWNGLSEYTALGDGLWIGQGHELGGVLVLEERMDREVGPVLILRRLEDGICTFVRANRVGELVAVAFSTPAGAVIWQTSMGVLRTLPPANMGKAPGPIVNEPKKEPSPMQGLTDAQFATLQRVRAKYGTHVTPQEIGAILNEVAWIHRAEGVGLQAKNGGTVAFQPRTNRMVWNGIRIGNIGQDVLGGASAGLATPTRGEAGPADPASFVAPVEPIGAVVVPPVDKPPVVQPPAPTVDLSDILRRLSKLEGPRTVAIKTDNGYYITAEIGGGGDVNATRTQVGGWETFTLEPR